MQIWAWIFATSAFHSCAGSADAISSTLSHDNVKGQAQAVCVK
jgi:hypothetical protein